MLGLHQVAEQDQLLAFGPWALLVGPDSDLVGLPADWMYLANPYQQLL